MRLVWASYFSREAYEYFMSPLGIFLWRTGMVCDLEVYLLCMKIRKTVPVLPSGRRMREDDILVRCSKGIRN